MFSHRVLIGPARPGEEAPGTRSFVGVAMPAKRSATLEANAQRPVETSERDPTRPEWMDPYLECGQPVARRYKIPDTMDVRLVEPHTAQLPKSALPDLPRSSLRLILDGVRSAHNVGAIFRTADAAAVEQIALLGVTPHPPHTQVEKTALGATEYVCWRKWEVENEMVDLWRREGYSLVALENGEGSLSLWDFAWPSKTALIVGSEVDGISESLLASTHHRVELPMFGYKGSLNVCTALGIATYEYLRQVRGGGGSPSSEKLSV